LETCANCSDCTCCNEIKHTCATSANGGTGDLCTSNDQCGAKAPYVNDFSFSPGDYCSTGAAGTEYVWFIFKYNDSNFDHLKKFRFQVDQNQNFENPEIDRTIDNLVDFYAGRDVYQQVTFKLTSATQGCDFLDFNSTYYWRVMVWDETGLASEWTSPTAYNVKRFKYSDIVSGKKDPSPVVNFTVTPGSPQINESVKFKNTSTCYEISGSYICPVHSWSIPGKYSGGNGKDEIEVTFTLAGTYEVTLEVSNDYGYCSITKRVKIGDGSGTPIWKEVSPF